MESKEREIKAIQARYRGEIDRLKDRNEAFKSQIETMKEKIHKKSAEITQLSFYKTKSERMDQVDKINLDLKNEIADLNRELSKRDQIIRDKGKPCSHFLNFINSLYSH